MTKKIDFKSLLNDLRHDERGVAAVILTIFLPVVVGFMTLATDMAYVHLQRNMLQITAESAALAATTELLNKNDDLARARTRAKDYAQKNMPTSRFGAVVKDADVVLGYWASSCSGARACFQPANGSSCGTVQCNAVQVTAQQSQTNGNALSLAFAPMIGLGSFNVGSSAIATAGPGTQNIWNAIIVQDVSSSFSEEIGDAKKADLALLDCMKQFAAAGSKLGLTVFAKGDKKVASLTNVVSGNQSLKDSINSLDICDSSLPSCSGTDLAAGMESARKQMCPSSSVCENPSASAPRQAMILITDGQPNYCSEDGRSCSSAKGNAEDEANRADDRNIDVYAIYYGDKNSDYEWMKNKLVKGNGQAFKTPNSSDLAGLMTQICFNKHRLVW